MERSRLNIYAYICLVASAFTCAFSLPAGRAFLGLSLIILIADSIILRKFISLSRTVWIGIAFISLLLFSTVNSETFSLEHNKLLKLVWFAGVPITAALVTSSWRLSGILGGYALGTGVLSVKTFLDSILLCVKARTGIGGGSLDYSTVLINAGSMTDGQRYMLGIVVVIAFIYICRRQDRPSVGWWILLLIQSVALILTLKRGSLICTCVLVSLFIIFKTNWKYLLMLLAVVVVVALLPPVKARLLGLKDEFRESKGGRATMWVKIAPELIKRHPWFGMGYRQLTNKMMVDIAPEVERERTHLHSNPIQVFVDGGIIGFVLYLVWMISAFVDAVRLGFRSRQHGPVLSATALALTLMLSGLCLHGLVEYNLGDAEIVLLYGLVMGCCAAGPSIYSRMNSDLSVCSGS